MKKLLALILSVLLCAAIFSCKAGGNADNTGVNQQNSDKIASSVSDTVKTKELTGAVSIVDGNIAVMDIPLGMNIKDAQAKMRKNGYFGEIEYENGYTGLEYEFERPITVNGMEIEEVVFVSTEKDGKIEMISLEVPELYEDVLFIRDKENIAKDVEEYFAKFSEPLKNTENGFETVLEGQDTIDGSPVIFDNGIKISTFAFVNGETVPLTSRDNLSQIKDAQIFEIYYASQPVTEEYADMMLRTDPDDFSPAYVQFRIGYADGLERIENYYR